MSPAQQPPSRQRLLISVVATFALASLMVARLLVEQPAGPDFLCFWTGGRVALTAPERLYDFAYLTAQQGWPFGPGVMRPYVNPPSALLLFAPLSTLPFWIGYAVLMLASLGVLTAAAIRARAPLWLLLLPSVAFTIFCGQLALLLVGLLLLGLTFRDRPLIAGLLFAMAAVLKPQTLVLLPLALAAQGQGRTILVTGAVGLATCAVSALLLGTQVWIDWFATLPRFHRLVMETPDLLTAGITPHATLIAHGWNGDLAYLLTPFAVWGVWTAFRRDAAWPDQLIALIGGALLISPYAMSYELALLAPAVAAYLARIRDRAWLVYVGAATLYAINAVFGLLSLLAVVALPFIAAAAARLEKPRAVSPT